MVEPDSAKVESMRNSLESITEAQEQKPDSPSGGSPRKRNSVIESASKIVSYAFDSLGSGDAKAGIKRQTTGPLDQSMNSFIRKDRGAVSQKVHNILDTPDSSVLASFYGKLDQSLIMFGVVLPIFQSMNDPLFDATSAGIFETTLEALFLVELFVRFIVCPDRYQFFKFHHNYFDLMACIPLAARASIGFVVDADDPEYVKSFLNGAVPCFRLLKLLRRFDKIFLLQNAFIDAAEALPVLIFMLTAIALTVSCLLYWVEPRNNRETLPAAMWMTVVTMTTVGYGDYTPETIPGYLVVTVLIIVSSLYMAMPLGIVGAAFTNVWRQRDCILLVKRARDQLQSKGYSAIDIPCLFKLFDSDQDGELSRGDFIRMIEAMSISLPTERAIEWQVGNPGGQHCGRGSSVHDLHARECSLLMPRKVEHCSRGG
jgi:hypothetical protein